MMYSSRPGMTVYNMVAISLWIGCLFLSLGCANTGMKSNLFGSKSSKEADKSIASQKSSESGNKQGTTPNPRMNSGEIVDNNVREGNLALSQKNHQQAKVAFNRALQYRPDHPAANHGMAIIADQEGRYAEAEQYYSTALRAEPRNADILGNLGYSYYLQRRYPESERYLRQALTANPQHKKSAYHLAQVYANINDYDRSLAMLRISGTEAQAQTEIAKLFPGRVPNGNPGINGQNLPVQQASEQTPVVNPPVDQNVSDMTATLRQKMEEERIRGIQQRKARNTLNNPVFQDENLTGYNQQQLEAIRQGRIADGMINDVFSKIDEQKSPVYLAPNQPAEQAVATNNVPPVQQPNPISMQQSFNSGMPAPGMPASVISTQQHPEANQPATSGNNLQQLALSAYARQAKELYPTFQGLDESTVMKILERDLTMMDQQTLAQRYPDLPVSLVLNRQSLPTGEKQPTPQYNPNNLMKNVSSTQQMNVNQAGTKLPEIIRHQMPNQANSKREEVAQHPGKMINMPYQQQPMSNPQQPMDQEQGHRDINVNTANMTGDPRWNLNEQNLLKEAGAQRQQPIPGNISNNQMYANPPTLEPSTMMGNNYPGGNQLSMPSMNSPNMQHPSYPSAQHIPYPGMDSMHQPAGDDYEQARQRAAEMGMGVGPGQLFPVMKNPQQKNPQLNNPQLNNTRMNNQQPVNNQPYPSQTPEMYSNPQTNLGPNMQEPVMPPHPWSNQMPDMNIPAAMPLYNSTQPPAMPSQYSQSTMMGTSNTIQTPPTTMGVNYLDVKTDYAGTINNSNNVPMNDPYQTRMQLPVGGKMSQQSSGQDLPQWPHAPTGSQADAYNAQREQAMQSYQQTQQANQPQAGLYSTPNNTTMNMRTVSNVKPETVNGVPDDNKRFNSNPVQPPQTAPSNWGKLPTIQPN